MSRDLFLSISFPLQYIQSSESFKFEENNNFFPFYEKNE